MRTQHFNRAAWNMEQKLSRPSGGNGGAATVTGLGYQIYNLEIEIRQFDNTPSLHGLKTLEEMYAAKRSRLADLQTQLADLKAKAVD